jgi:ParB family chromosome partitioning protein
MNTEALQMIPVSRLVQAPENVRKTNTGAGIEELKASILAEGLLQNLIAYPTEKEKFAVVGGERRRKALAALIKEKKLGKAHAVPCLVRDREEAIALSLAENVQREGMHPADQFEAFSALVAQGKAIEDVAARYGVTPAVVTRRLKLAAVAPAVMAAFRADSLSLEAVMGFTVSDDHAEQERVLAHFLEQGRRIDRQAVIRMLTHEQVSTDDPRFRYVSEDAYVEAGGIITRDLFSADGIGFATDSALLDKLTIEKLAAEVPALLAVGWKWIEPAAEHSFEMTRGFARIHATYQPLPAEDQARLAAAHERLDEIIEETDGEPEEGPLAEEYASLSAEIERIEDRQMQFHPEEMALAGGWVTLDEDGAVSPVLGYVRPEDLPALDALRQAEDSPREASGDEEGIEGADDEGVTSPLPAPDQTASLSDALLTDLHAARTIALRLELAQRPDIALRLVAHSLATQVITRETTAARVSVHETYIPAISKTHCPDDEPLKARIGHWKLRLPDRAGQLWPAILGLREEDVLDLITVCTAVSIDATHNKPADFSTRQRMAHADQLAETLRLDMAQHWTPTAEGFFGRVSKATILDAVTEAAGPSAASRLAGLKKPAMAAEAETVIAGTGWLPNPLRTRAGQEEGGGVGHWAEAAD